MKNTISCLLFFFFMADAFAQNVGINTPTPTSSLDINGGLRLRQLVTTVTGANVMLVSNRAHHVLSGIGTGDFTISFTDATLEGQHVIITNNTLYTGFLVPIYIQPNTTVELIYSSAAWKQIGSNESIAATAWSRTGNSGATDGVNNLLGTKNSIPIRFLLNNQPSGFLDAGSANYFLGLQAGLNADASSFANVGIGSQALRRNVTGGGNVAIGYEALSATKEGFYNTALGLHSLRHDTAGSGTLAVGAFSLFWNKARFGNTAVGTMALYNNTNPDKGAIASTGGMHNTAVGHSALYNNRSGYDNVAVGFEAAFNNDGPFGVVAIGNKALHRDEYGLYSIAIGNEAASKAHRGRGTIAIGYHAFDSTALNNPVGAPVNWDNIAIGTGSMGLHNQNTENVAVGYATLTKNVDGDNNVVVGAQALQLQTNGSLNVVVGSQALLYNTTGNNNVALGFGSFQNLEVGSNSVGIGYKSGYNETTSNKLYLENSDANKDNALIYGDFAADSLLLNAKTINKFSLNVRGSNALEMGYGAAGKQTDAGKLCYGCFGDPAHWLGIVGGGVQANGGNDRVIKLWSEGGLRIKGNALPDANNFYSLGTSGQRWKEVWTNAGAINTSDANLKTNIANSPYGLDEVMQMNPVQYNWRTNPDDDLQIGFLAQDIQKIIPEAVVVPANGDPLGMKYTELIPVLVKAIQELKNEITELKKQLNK